MRRNTTIEDGARAGSPRDEQVIFDELVSLCASPGFTHAIASFCFRDNLVRFKDELKPDDLLHLRSGAGLIRTEISTLIGLLARKPIDLKLPPPDVSEDYLSRAEALLHELHKSLSSVWFKDFDLEKAKSGEFDPFSSGPALREPIFYGGDSAYNFQYRDFATKKYAKDGEWLAANKGFDISTALKVVDALASLLVKNLLSLRESLRSKPSIQWTLLPAFTFSLKELAEQSEIDGEIVSRVVEAFCLPKGDSNSQFTALSEYNATVATPILAADTDKFILFQNYSLMEAIYESPFFWMAADRAYAATALSNRGQYTEELSFERLRKVFRDNVHANVRLRKSKGDELGEIDVLVVFGDRAIVLQAKSKRLTLEARKGNDLRIKDDFKKAIQAAYDQALSCSKAMVEGECKLIDADGKELTLPNEVKQVFPVCVVSDHYPALAFQARQFLKFEAGDKIVVPLVTDVFALDAITEMLETPLRVLSYLELRSSFGQKILTTHELTLLSMHLKYNLWVNKKYDLVVFEDDISVHLDAAMAVRRVALPGARTPSGVLTRMQGTHVGRILREIESRPDPQTIPLGLLLLSLGEESINTINKGIAVIVAQAARDGRNHDFTICFGDLSSGLTIHCNNRPPNEAADPLFNHCNLRKYSQKAARWFGLAIAPRTGAIRFGLTLEGGCIQDPAMDAAVENMPAGIRPKKIAAALDRAAARSHDRKVGRNDPCPCGSGRKYKRCCLPR